MRNTTLQRIADDVQALISWEDDGATISWFTATLGMMCLDRNHVMVGVHAVVVGIHHDNQPGVVADFNGCNKPAGSHGYPPQPSRAGRWVTFMVVFSDGSRGFADQSLAKPIAEA